MSAEAIRYTVVCQHDAERCDVADINDERPIGGAVRIDNFRSHGIPVTARNKLGSRRRLVFACAHCPTNVELADTSVAEVLDRLGPHRQMLTEETVPVVVPNAEAGEWVEALTGSATEGRWTTTGHERRYLLPLGLLAQLSSELRRRDV